MHRLLQIDVRPLKAPSPTPRAENVLMNCDYFQIDQFTAELHQGKLYNISKKHFCKNFDLIEN